MIGQTQWQSPNTPQTNIFWVQGIEGAKAYPVAPGNTVALWDSENQAIYIKMVDASGIPQPLRILDFTERVRVPEVTKTKYVTADELNDILDSKLGEIKDLLNSRNSYKRGGKNNGQSSV